MNGKKNVEVSRVLQISLSAISGMVLWEPAMETYGQPRGEERTISTPVFSPTPAPPNPNTRTQIEKIKKQG